MTLQGWLIIRSHAEKTIPPESTKAGIKPKALEKKPVAYWTA